MLLAPKISAMLIMGYKFADLPVIRLLGAKIMYLLPFRFT